MRRLLICLGAVLASSLTGCNGNDSSTGGDSDPTATTKPATASCRDRNGHGQGGDLVSTSLRWDGPDLVVKYRTGKPLPTTGSARLLVQAENRASEDGYGFDMRWRDGQQKRYRVANFAKLGPSEELDGQAVVRGNTVTATFPIGSAVRNSTFTWTAVYIVNGKWVDTCRWPGWGYDWKRSR